MTQVLAPLEGLAVNGELIAGTLGVPTDELNAFSVDPAQLQDFLGDSAATMLGNLGLIKTRPDIPHTTIAEKGGVEVRTHVEAIPNGQASELLVERTVLTDIVTSEVFGARRVVRSFLNPNGDFRVENREVPAPLSDNDAAYLCMQGQRWRASHPA